MKLGYIGLGKMGLGMVARLVEKGNEAIVYDPNESARQAAADAGAKAVGSIAELVGMLEHPRTVWIMVPHGVVDDVLRELVPVLEPGDTVIDGGNSPYKESVRRAKELADRGIDFVDVGVSGGPSGARHGACLMVGGDRKVYDRYEELFRDIAVEGGYGYMGPSGAGHFVKMVHNGIEYGMMQAIGEGFEVLKKSDFGLDVREVARVYNRESVIESRLIGWLSQAYKEHGAELEGISGSVAQSGEGLWTIEAARELGVATPIIEGSVAFRKESQEHPSYTGQVVSALRNQFGGHEVKR